MIIFKTFFKILKKYKGIVILYTAILIVFSIFNMQTNNNSQNFVAIKPNVLIINDDQNVGVTKNLIDYIKNNCNCVNMYNDQEKINDALYYKKINYVIYIPNNYEKDFLNGKNPQIQIKSSHDYAASLADILLNRYINIANMYRQTYNDENEIISKTNETLSKNINTNVTTKLDTGSLSKATYYYNFLNYSILATGIYIVGLILSKFRNQNIHKRTAISSMNYEKFNRYLFLSNSLFVVILWIFYVILSFILVGKIMFNANGILYIINSFVFTICVLAISFLIANITANENAINALTNIIALGTSFLCGAFIQVTWLPSFVVKIAHILPSYYYINTNNMIESISEINILTLKPIIINMIILLGFTLIFIIITNIVSKKKLVEE